ncbi:phosphoglycerate kinase [Candidatus Woesearchaeota archaeon]|nr:phosphoglycerate kinase [Candidatus Woesearchaeota archaeon]
MKSIKSFKVKNKRVLVRVDFNVPLDKKGNITDDKKIKAVIPTLKHLIKNNAMIILMSHLGRPKGRIDEKLRMDKPAKKLSKLIKQPVYYVDDCMGNDVENFIDDMVPGEILVLENLRFYKEEKENNKRFAMSLSELADIYVNDAFAASHRAHASMEAITDYLPSAAGFLLKKEIDSIKKIITKPKKPFVAVMGGAKVSDKIELIKKLLKKVDKIMIGGAMMFTFYKAQGLETGKSLVEKDKLKLAKDILKRSKDKIILPVDTLVASKIDKSAKKTKNVDVKDIPKNMAGADIGKETIKKYKEIISGAKTIIWNGPMGVFEIPRFAKGTKEIAKNIADSKAVSLVGGGESAAAVDKLKLQKKFNHVSTAGGAFLEFLEGKKLPAIKALEKNQKRFK